MLSYTQASIKASLQTFNVNSDPDFVTNLPEIIRKGEMRLARYLDLDNLDTMDTSVSTANGVATVTKPTTLTFERLVEVTVAGKTTYLKKRSRAWVDFYANTAANGTPIYYAERNETTWALAPIPAGVYGLTIHGAFDFVSIMDGSGTATTWFSTQVPELFYLACSIEACEYLKAWAKKAQNEADFNRLAAEFVATAKQLQRADIEDIIGMRQNQNPTGTQQG
jgi:hypothetical protein